MWSEIFEYRQGRLYWKIKISRKINVGDEAGYRTSVRGGDRWVIRFNGKRYYRYRIVWEMHNGKITNGHEIDHIDHDQLNDEIENFEEKPRIKNMHNKKKSPRNKSGITGVRKEGNKWCSQLFCNGVMYRKRFDNIDDAINYRKNLELQFSFHENHGK